MYESLKIFYVSENLGLAAKFVLLPKHLFYSSIIYSYAGDAYTVGKKTMKAPRGNTLECEPNWMLLDKSCGICFNFSL